MKSTFQSVKNRFLSHSGDPRQDRSKLKIIHPHLKDKNEAQKSVKSPDIESTSKSKKANTSEKQRNKAFPWSRRGNKKSLYEKKDKVEEKCGKKKNGKKRDDDEEESKSSINKIGGILRRSMYGLRFSGMGEEEREFGDRSDRKLPARPRSLHGLKDDDNSSLSLFSYVRKSINRRSKDTLAVVSVEMSPQHAWDENDELSRSESMELYSSGDISLKSIKALKESQGQNAASSMSLGSDVNVTKDVTKTDNDLNVKTLEFNMDSIPTNVPRLDNKAAYDKIALRPKCRKAARKARGVPQHVLQNIDGQLNGFDDFSPTEEKISDVENESRESSPKAKRSRPPSEATAETEPRSPVGATSQTSNRYSMGRSPLGAGPAMFALSAQDVQAIKLRKTPTFPDHKKTSKPDESPQNRTQSFTKGSPAQTQKKSKSNIFSSKPKKPSSKKSSIKNTTPSINTDSENLPVFSKKDEGPASPTSLISSKTRAKEITKLELSKESPESNLPAKKTNKESKVSAAAKFFSNASNNERTKNKSNLTSQAARNYSENNSKTTDEGSYKSSWMEADARKEGTKKSGDMKARKTSETKDEERKSDPKLEKKLPKKEEDMKRHPESEIQNTECAKDEKVRQSDASLKEERVVQKSEPEAMPTTHDHENPEVVGSDVQPTPRVHSPVTPKPTSLEFKKRNGGKVFKSPENEKESESKVETPLSSYKLLDAEATSVKADEEGQGTVKTEENAIKAGESSKDVVIITQTSKNGEEPSVTAKNEATRAKRIIDSVSGSDVDNAEAKKTEHSLSDYKGTKLEADTKSSRTLSPTHSKYEEIKPAVLEDLISNRVQPDSKIVADEPKLSEFKRTAQPRQDPKNPVGVPSVTESPAGKMYSRSKLKPIGNLVNNTFEERRNASMKISSPSSPSRTQRTRSFNVSSLSTNLTTFDKRTALKEESLPKITTASIDKTQSDNKNTDRPIKSPLKKYPNHKDDLATIAQDAENNNVKLSTHVARETTPDPSSDATEPARPTPRPRKNSKTTLTENPSPSSIKDHNDADGSKAGSTPSWVHLARRRSKVWEDAGAKSHITIAPRTFAIETTKSVNRNDRPQSLAVFPKPTATGLKSQENTPQSVSDASPKPISQQAKSSITSPLRRVSPLVASSKVSSNRKSIPDVTAPERRYTASNTKDPTSAQPSWLAIAMQKQKRWTAEETV